MNIKQLLLFSFLIQASNADFLYHDSAITNGGEFSVNFPIGNLKNGGYSSPTATENASVSAGFLSYATRNPPSGGYPVTITLEFDSPVSLDAFYLWNHTNSGSAIAVNQGVNAFSLTFYTGSDGTGSQIGSTFSANAAKAPSSGTYGAETFNFGATYESVRSVVFTANNHNPSSNFVAMREIAFEGTIESPSDFIYHDSATTNGGEFNTSFPIGNLKNGGYRSPAATEDASAAAADLSYATKNPPTGGSPVVITLEFDSLASLEAFYLWNHSNSGAAAAPDQGVNTFTLTFYDGPGGTGSQIGSTYSANAAKAPATGNYAAETFDFGTIYSGVRSVVFTASNHAGGSFIGMREIGFKGSVAPLPPGPAPTPGKLIVYLVGGQSNADGYGVTSQLESGLQTPQADIDFYHSNTGGSSPLTANQWIPLQPGSGSKPGNAGGFGPELSFAIAIHDALGSEGARIAIIKHALGGSSLHTDWIPGGDATTAGDGPVYQAFQSTVTSALSALAVLYPDASVQLEGMIWHQGEADSGSTVNAEAYESRLTTFIADLRATYGEGLKFGIVQLSDTQTSLDPTRRATVKLAQTSVADADPLSYLVISDDLPMAPGSAIHFGTPSVLTIGSRLAAGMQLVPINDGDGNHIDDDWEELHWGLGNAGQDPGGNDDGDSLSNLEEFLWLTDPRAANVVSVDFQAMPTPTLTWPSSPDRRYLIEASLDLESWQRLDSFIPGSPGESTSFEIPADLITPRHFFRVTVQR